MFKISEFEYEEPLILFISSLLEKKYEFHTIKTQEEHQIQNLSPLNHRSSLNRSYYLIKTMKLEQSTLQRTFTVKHQGKSYHIDYLNSNGQILGLLNRNYWEVTDEDGEEVNIYEFQSQCKKEREQIKQNRKLVEKLINFCIRHFEDYQPD